MIDVSNTQASHLAGSERAKAPRAIADQWELFLEQGVPPQVMASVQASWALGEWNVQEELRAFCSPSADHILALYAWLKRQAIQKPIERVVIAVLAESGREEQAYKAAESLSSACSKFLLLPCEIKAKIY